MGRRGLFVIVPVILAVLVAVAAAPRVEHSSVAQAKGGGGGTSLAPLSAADVPRPPNIDQFVADRAAAVRLGKAFFWDMQAGSDGQTACATCHFNAGADSRSRNTISPRGGNFDPNPPNTQLTADDFPFHKLADPNDRNSQVLADSANVAGSQGVHKTRFSGITPGHAEDDYEDQSDSTFSVDGANVRQVTGRNAPPVINAVFNFRNFWDGRAQNVFNGVNPFGNRDANARVGKVNGGNVDDVQVQIPNSSLASQAVGPPNNGVEMAADGRTWPDLGRKLLSLQPLANQRVSSSDSVLGPVADGSGVGLDSSYAAMIRQAFKPDWWDASGLMERNFSLYWGLAIQEYESTLVSDDTPFDRFMAGDAAALSPQAQAGMSIFAGKGGCTECHLGPELTSASVSNVNANGVTSNEEGAFVDTGFLNIGVRPTGDDAGNAGQDPFGNSLSETRLAGLQPERVDGSFKVPGLRNVALTGPYFHTGGYATLRQVVDFYNRGGNFANAEIDPNMVPLGLTEAEKDDLVAFLEALTDPRVRLQAAPFDHPELFVPSGAQTNSDGSLQRDGRGRGLDCFLDFPATGTTGGSGMPGFLSFVGPPCVTPVSSPVSSSGGSGGGSGGSSGSSDSPNEQAGGGQQALQLSVLRARVRHGRLQITVRCSESCRVRAVARQSRRIVGRSRGVSVGTRARRFTFRLRHVRAGRRLRFEVAASTADGRRAVVRRALSIRR